MKFAAAILILIAIPTATFLAALHCYDTGYVYGSIVTAFVGGLVEFFTLVQIALSAIEWGEPDEA